MAATALLAPFGALHGQAPPLDLSAVPEPDVAALEPAVREQLRAARQAASQATGAGLERAFSQLCLMYMRYELHGSVEVCLSQLAAAQPDEHRWAYYQLLHYDETGNLQAAAESAARAMALQGEHVPTLIRTADILLMRGEVAEAKLVYSRLLGLAPDNSAGNYGLGRIALEEGEADRAIAYLQAALRGQPEGSVVHHQLGMAFRAVGDSERAREELAKNRQVPLSIDDPLVEALAALGSKSEELFNQAVTELGSGRTARGIARLVEYLAEHPDDAEAHYTLSTAYVDQQKLDLAEQELKLAIEHDSEHPQAHFNLGLLYGRTRRRAEAGQMIERAALLDPDNLRWRTMAAQAMAERGDPDAAVRELETVLALDPSFLQARGALARLLVVLGRPSAARPHYERLVELQPDEPGGHFGLAITSLNAGDVAGALATLESAATRFPEDLQVNHLLARLLATVPDASMRDAARALQLAEKVLQKQPNPDFAETLAMALAENGRFEDAASLQEQIISREREARGTVLPEREQRLELYRAGQPVRLPGGP